MPTIREVAQKAGVSPAAVSLVLNGKDCRLSESTKRRIFRCARELNYQPGKRHFPPASRSLPVIGILVPDITNLFFADLCRSCQDEARKSGYQVILCSTDAFEESEYASIDTFLKQKLDGIIFIHSSGLSEEKQEKNLSEDLRSRASAGFHRCSQRISGSQHCKDGSPSRQLSGRKISSGTGTPPDRLSDRTTEPDALCTAAGLQKSPGRISDSFFSGTDLRGGLYT